MKIKFKYLNLYYLFATFISPICVLIIILKPDIGKSSNELHFLCLAIILALGASGFLLVILEKTKIIKISYSEEDKKAFFYKIIQVTEKFKIKILYKDRDAHR